MTSANYRQDDRTHDQTSPAPRLVSARSMTSTGSRSYRPARLVR